MNTSNRCMGCMETIGGGGPCPSCGWDPAAQPAATQHLTPGTLLEGNYIVGRALGQGGFGITYLGWDQRLSRKVAIKEYFPQTLASRQMGNTMVIATTTAVQDDFTHGLESFMREAQILARFGDHPCIVSVQNLFNANGTGYMVMGYLEGMTLAQYLVKEGGKIPFETASRILLPVMDGVREVHAQGLLHRDISPDNIYLTRQGPVKILDFGAARFAVSERSQSLSVVLKEGYAPEEQYRRSGNQGPWTDVYAIGATLYRAITGAAPASALDRLHQDTLASPRSSSIPMPAAAESALLRALAVRQKDRFLSVEEFQKALIPPTASEPAARVESVGLKSVESVELKPNARSPFGWGWAVGALALALVVAGGLVWTQRSPSQPAEVHPVLDDIAPVKPAPAPTPPPPNVEVRKPAVRDKTRERADQLVGNGKRELEEGHYDAALRDFRQAVDLDPGRRAETQALIAKTRKAQQAEAEIAGKR